MRKLVACLAIALVLGGCPPVPTFATLNIHNTNDSVSIVEIRFTRPSDAGYGPNLLEAALAPGEMTSFELEAPTLAADADGVYYSVLAVSSEPLACEEDTGDPDDESVLTIVKVSAGREFNWYWGRDGCDSFITQ